MSIFTKSGGPGALEQLVERDGADGPLAPVSDAHTRLVAWFGVNRHVTRVRPYRALQNLAAIRPRLEVTAGELGVRGFELDAHDPCLRLGAGHVRDRQTDVRSQVPDQPRGL